MASCHEKIKSRTFNNDTTLFYPASSFIENEIKDVNATPYFIYKVIKQNNIIDSTPVTLMTFNTFAKKFVSVNITDPHIKKYYKETIFHDGSTASIIFSYATDNPDLPVQSETIMLNDVSQQVKRLFINKKLIAGDSVIFEKLSWKANESFLINRIIHARGIERTEETMIIWNNKNDKR